MNNGKKIFFSLFFIFLLVLFLQLVVGYVVDSYANINSTLGHSVYVADSYANINLTLDDDTDVAPILFMPGIDFVIPTILNNTNTTFPYIWANVTVTNQSIITSINITLYSNLVIINSTSSLTSP